MLRECDRDRPFAFEDGPGVDDRDGDQRTAGVELEVVAFGRRIVERRSAGLSSPEVENVGFPVVHDVVELNTRDRDGGGCLMDHGYALRGNAVRMRPWPSA
jgi:hypothetical protein